MKARLPEPMSGVLIEDDSKPYVRRIVEEWGSEPAIVVEVREIG